MTNLDSGDTYFIEIKSFTDEMGIETITELAQKHGKKFCCEIQNGKLILRDQSDFYFQIIGQLAIVGLSFCDLVLSFRQDIEIIRVTFNQEDWGKMKSKLRNFYVNCILPEIHTQRAKNYSKLYKYWPLRSTYVSIE